MTRDARERGYHDASSASSMQAPTPGRSRMPGATLPRTTHEIDMPPDTVTGDALADDGVDAQGPGVFLAHDQRAQLVHDGAMRWLACEERLHSAILSVGLREAIKPDDPLPMWISLLVEAAGISMTIAAGNVVDSAHERGAELLRDADVWTSLGAVASRRERALMALTTVSPLQIDALVEIGVSAGEKAADRTLDADPHRERDAVLEVLDGFHDRMAVVFQGVREQAPARAIASADDAALLAWFRMPAADGPLTMTFWRDQVERKLVRFRRADLLDVGTGRSRLGFTSVETRLQWRHDHVTGAQRLAVVDVVVTDGCPLDPTEAEFVRWVPGEFERSAIDLSEARGAEIIGEHPDAPPSCELDVSGSMLATVVPL